MRTHSSARFLGILIGLSAVGVGIGLRADEPPSDAALAKLGLKRAGTLLVLEAESEVHAKAEEVRRLSRQLSSSVAQQRATLSEKEYQDTIKELNAELNQFKSQLNAVNQTINRLPKRRGYPANSFVAEEQQELTYYRNQLQMEINQGTAFLNQLKSKPYDPKARLKADSDVRDKQEALHQAAQELRKLVDGVHEKYEAVAKESQVKKWLDTPEGTAGVKPKLGPSRAFQADVKMLEKIEQASGSDDSGSAPSAKAARKGRRAKAKRPAGAGNAASPF
jgi:uncharacterized phage infection (PIP) family protein YhgE